MLSIQSAACAALLLAGQVTAAPQYAPLALDTPFGQSRQPASAVASDDSLGNGALSHFRKLESDELQVSSFLASRATKDATNYRVYLGVGYKQELTSFARLSGRTFYGAGTYDGTNPEGGSLPDEVRSAGYASGAWVGSNWQVESRLFDRHSFSAGMEYRQQMDMPLLEISEFLAKSDFGVAQPARKVGFVTRTRLALSPKLALNLRTRLDQMNAQTNSIELGMEHSGPNGQRAQLSWARQDSKDAFSQVGQQLAKLRMDLPEIAPGLNTGFELQYLAVATALDDGRRARNFLIGNLTLTRRDISNRTKVSVGLNNLFGARDTIGGPGLLSYIPPDGRTLRLDLVRKL